jgi:hypothetical protein
MSVPITTTRDLFVIQPGRDPDEAFPGAGYTRCIDAGAEIRIIDVSKTTAVVTLDFENRLYEAPASDVFHAIGGVTLVEAFPGAVV